jgi:hypothetical protein
MRRPNVDTFQILRLRMSQVEYLQIEIYPQSLQHLNIQRRVAVPVIKSIVVTRTVDFNYCTDYRANYA